jgi:hypothetical protein
VADRFAHPSDLAIAAFADANEDHGLVFARGSVARAHRGRRGPAAVEHDALREAIEDATFGHASDARFVEPFDAVTRVRESRRQLAVVGEEQQPFRIVIESADWIDAFADAWQQVDDGRPALRVDDGRHIPARLVQQEIAERFAYGDSPAVDPDVVVFRVGFRAEFAHDRAVHADAALEHQAFGGAPGGHAGG